MRMSQKRQPDMLLVLEDFQDYIRRKKGRAGVKNYNEVVYG